MSQEAYNMRAEIHQMLLSGDTERQIIDIYKARYGMRILAEPEGAYWWIATFTPPVVLASGVVALILLVRKWSRSSRAQTAS
jgi:cytochrome c-type biogenesis protein CcmH/NrfF